MISTSVPADYAEVFMNTTPDHNLETVWWVVLGVGFLIMIAGSVLLAASYPLVVGGLIVCLAATGLFIIQDASHRAIHTVATNMVSNVQAKYHAELNLDRSTIDKNKLDKPQEAVLIFDNGSSAEYEMYFQKSGEPMLVEDAQPPTPPTVQELNAGNAPQPTKSASPENTPEPAK